MMLRNVLQQWKIKGNGKGRARKGGRLHGGEQARAYAQTGTVSSHSYAYVPSHVPLAGYEHFVREGYQQNVIVYRCINVVARALSSVPLFYIKWILTIKP